MEIKPKATAHKSDDGTAELIAIQEQMNALESAVAALRQKRQEALKKRRMQEIRKKLDQWDQKHPGSYEFRLPYMVLEGESFAEWIDRAGRDYYGRRSWDGCGWHPVEWLYKCMYRRGGDMSHPAIRWLCELDDPRVQDTAAYHAYKKSGKYIPHYSDGYVCDDPNWRQVTLTALEPAKR